MSPIKETNYFAYSACEGARYLSGTAVSPEQFLITTDHDYLALFAGVTTEEAIGEASPLYLGSMTAPMAIRRQLPDVRLVAILRNPIDRAYSGYQMHLRSLRTELPTSQAFDPNQHWVQQGMYHAMLARYYELFDSSRIKVLLFDDLKADPAGLLRELYRFLAVDEHFIPPSLEPQNPGGTPRSRALVAAAMRIRPAMAMLPPGLRSAVRAAKHKVLFRRGAPMPPEIRDRLRAVYRKDVGRLSALLDVDLERRWLDSS